MFKKVLCALVMFALLLIPMSGCGEDKAVVVTIDGVGVYAPEYLMYQLNAYQTIASQMSYTFTGKTTAQQMKLFDSVNAIRVDTWIATKTLEDLRLKIYYSRMFDKYGLKISAVDVQSNHDNSVKIYDAYQSKYGSYYSKNGINEATFESWMTDNFKQQAVFNKIYDVGGTKAVADKDFNAYVEANYGRMKLLSVPYFNTSTGYAFSDAQIADIQKTVSNMTDNINAGGSIDAINNSSMHSLGLLKSTETAAAVEDTFFAFNNTQFTDDMIKAYKTLKIGQAGNIKDTNAGYFYIYLKEDPIATGTTYFKENRYAVLSAMKDQEFQNDSMKITGDYKIVSDKKEMTRYSPYKIFQNPANTASSTATSSTKASSTTTSSK